MPRSLVRTWTEAMERADALSALSATRALRNQLSDCERVLVDEAVAEGASWEDVASALGISRQAAWRKFRRRDAAAQHGSDQEADSEAAALRLRHRLERKALFDRQRHEIQQRGDGV